MLSTEFSFGTTGALVGSTVLVATGAELGRGVGVAAGIEACVAVPEACVCAIAACMAAADGAHPATNSKQIRVQSFTCDWGMVSPLHSGYMSRYRFVARAQRKLLKDARMPATDSV